MLYKTKVTVQHLIREAKPAKNNIKHAQENSYQPR